MSVIEQRGQVAAVHRVRQARNQLRDKCADSLVYHAYVVHRTDRGDPMVPKRCHLEICRVLQDADTFPFVIFIVPPGYGKTTWLVDYTTWRQGATHGRLRLGLISNTATQAVNFSRAVQDGIASPAFQKVYPDVLPDQERGWATNQWYLLGCPEGTNPSVFACGIGGPMQGRRFDEIVLDDPTTWEEARSDVIMESQRTWLRGVLLQRFPVGVRPPTGKGVRFVGIMTRWSPRDLVATFRDLGFAVIRMPSLGYWDRTVTCSECAIERAHCLPWEGPLRTMPDEIRNAQEDALLEEHVYACSNCGSEHPPEVEYGEAPLWPEVEGIEQLEAERASDEILFELVKQGNADILAGETFDPNWFKRGTPPRDTDFASIVQGVDTAGGKDRRRGDFFAMITVGVLPNGHCWVLDVDRGRYPAPEQQARIERNHEKWAYSRPVDILAIEDANEGRAIYQYLIRETRLPLKDVTPQGDKEFRSIPLANAYRGGLMWHAEEKWVKSLEAELESFPDGSHDDMVDALAIAFNETGRGPSVYSL